MRFTGTSRNESWRRPARVGLVMAASAVLAFATACSSSGSNKTASSGSGDASSAAGCAGSSSATSQLPTHLPSEYTALAKQPPSGKSLIYIGSSTATSTPETSGQFEETAKLLNWKYQLLQYDGTVPDFNQKLADAVRRHPDAIAALGIPAVASQQPLQQATAAGITVVYGSTSDTPVGTPGLAAIVNGAPAVKIEAAAAADWLIEDSHCAAKVVYYGLPVPILQVAGKQMQDTFAAKCPSCKIDNREMALTDIGTPAGTSEIISALQADRSINYVGVATGGQALGLPAALKQAGFGNVKIFGITAPNQEALQALQNKTESMWVDTTGTMIAWAITDALLRAFGTGKAVPQLPYPFAILSQENIPQQTSTFPVYPLDFKNEFRQLWHVG